jgi:hypothetical protein
MFFGCSSFSYVLLQASKQASKQANKQASKQASKKASERASRGKRASEHGKQASQPDG